ncbi:MAG: hypothetical protein GXP58_10375 [Deltaproteobacteria bacterium]|nr:hypothetical protein [Deltaproteobacteria bacterium]
MTEKKKPLPRPPRKGFGPRRGPDTEGPLSADKMAAAMAQGKLEEYLSQEFQGNEQAQNLAKMMMGMTGMSGMMPSGGSVGSIPPAGGDPAGPPEVPEDIRQASLTGDMGQLMTLMKQEHEKRSGGEQKAGEEAPTKKSPDNEKASAPSAEAPALLDRESIDLLIRIASENSVSLDWVIARAIKLYARDYKLTGRV